MDDLQQDCCELIKDPRFQRAVDLFNGAQWYSAHDLFEELWHETNGLERRTLQGVLQIAVAELHLERGNKFGATVLYGEGLGRLRCVGTPDLGLDIDCFCSCLEQRFEKLQRARELESSSLPVLNFKHE